MVRASALARDLLNVNLPLPPLPDENNTSARRASLRGRRVGDGTAADLATRIRYVSDQAMELEVGDGWT
jgi:hypothetical protein